MTTVIEPESAIQEPHAPTAEIEEVIESVVEQVAEVVEEEIPASDFERAVLNYAPPLAWSDDNDIHSAADIEIEDESSMRWSEEPATQAPAAADPNDGLPEFLTQEIPLIQEAAESKKDKKRREKEERKAQKLAARYSRHAND